MSFSEDLKINNIDTWKKILNHKFIKELSGQDLPKTKFIFYLKQDKIFLRAFCDSLAAASRIASDNEMKTWFEGLIENTNRYEIPMQEEILHQLDKNYVKSFSVCAEQTTRDYASYMNIVSDSGDLELLVSAMAPCPWTYYEISNAVIRKNIKSEAFKKWLLFYSSKESHKQVNQIKELLNKLAQNEDKKKKIDMKNHFSTSCKYELEFWDMAYSQRK